MDLANTLESRPSHAEKCGPPFACRGLMLSIERLLQHGFTAALVVAFTAPTLAPKAFAEPTTQEEAAEFLSRVREVEGWDDDVDIDAVARQRERQARAAFDASPRSGHAMRDLADALHMLGHLAEHQWDYPTALRYHEESLALFKQTRLPSRQSFHGTDHAYEHIFMAHYNAGLVAERAGDAAAAEAHYARAHAFVADNNLERWALRSGRMRPGYARIVRRLGDSTKEVALETGVQSPAQANRQLASTHGSRVRRGATTPSPRHGFRAPRRGGRPGR